VAKNNLLFKNIRLVEPGKGIAPPQDILVRGGKIVGIGSNLQPEPSDEVITTANAHVSIGWMDVGVYVCDPGFEHREDLSSATKAAAAAGFTAIAVMPNTQPAIHSKSEIAYLQNKSAGGPVAVIPIGAISHDCAGKDLAELFDMHTAGAVAFTDGTASVQDGGLLLRAMEYAKAFHGLIINHPYDKSVASGGQMHEGVVSTSLGLKGIPALSEHLVVQRDLSLLEYAGAGARLHIHLISSAHSVEMIRKAKAAGLPVTASVALANLCFTDKDMAMEEGASPFDTNLKVMPPLRTPADREALIAGVLDGVIDFVCTNHNPWDEEAKKLEFPYADFGMNGLETAFSMYRMYLYDRIPLDRWVDAIAIQPRKVLGLPVPEIAVGATANLTIFDTEQEWTLTIGNMLSKSHNSPFLNKTLKGKCVAIYG
jgi:dihydroorotase